MIDISKALSIQGWMDEDELQWLAQQAARFNSIIEIGCWKGRSAAALATNSNAHVWTVDHFQGSPGELDSFHAEVKEQNIHTVAADNLISFPNAFIFHGSSADAAKLFFTKSAFDMVFIDGEHTREAVANDLRLWYPRCKKLICGHDINWPGVALALVDAGIHFHYGPGSLWYHEKE